MRLKGVVPLWHYEEPFAYSFSHLQYFQVHIMFNKCVGLIPQFTKHYYYRYSKSVPNNVYLYNILLNCVQVKVRLLIPEEDMPLKFRLNHQSQIVGNWNFFEILH